MNITTLALLAIGLGATTAVPAEVALGAARDRLAAELAARPVASQWLLRLDEGADHDDLELTLRRVNGQWATAYVEVPGWQQSTMQEWRGFHLANRVGGCWRPNRRFTADPTRLGLATNRLNGTLAVAYQLDQTMLQRQPPGVKLQWWDKFIPGGYSIPRTQQYAIAAEVQQDRALLELVLADGLYWDSAFAPKAKPAARTITRKPIQVRLQVPGTRFTRASARTPTWNGGFHEVDATGLQFANGQLTGTLVVFIHQDGWMPWGASKQTQHEPLPITFQLDARLLHNQLTGTYTATLGGALKGAAYRESEKTVVIPETQFAGTVGGRGGPLVIGRYTATGDLGEQTGPLDGMLLDQPPPLHQQLAAAGTDPSTLFHQVRALHLALQHYPLPFAEAWQQTDLPAPQTSTNWPSLGQLPAIDQPLPPARRETVGDSPSTGALALPVSDDANLLAIDHQGWAFLSHWQVLGPFEQRIGLENNSGLLPDLVVLPEAGYTQPIDRLGARQDQPVPIRWRPVTTTSPRLGVPWDSAGLYIRFAGRLWYGAARLRSAQARPVWLSLEANDFAKLWINNRLVWVDTEKAWRYRANGRVFVRVDLRAGDNQLLARVHNDRRLSWLRLALTTQEPSTPEEPTPAPALDNPFVLPSAQPPLVWDIGQGINVAWRNPALGGRSRPVTLGQSLLVATEDGVLHSIDAANGQERWAVQVGDTELAEPVTDGQRIYAHAGAVVCLDQAGNQLWRTPTGFNRGRLYLAGQRVVLEGEPTGPKPKTTMPATVLILDAANGQPLHRIDLAGKFENRGELLTSDGVSVLLSATGVLVDIASGSLRPPPDIETQSGSNSPSVFTAPYTVSRSANRLFLTSQAQHQAVRFWAKDGRLAFAHLWQSNYGNSGFGNVPAPAVANDRYLFTTHSVLAHTPHCPDPRAEINVQDLHSGRWLNRLKPALDDLYSYGALNLKTPVIAGDYLFLLGGRADNKRNQIAIATADQALQLVACNDVEPGTAVPPLFAGNRLFLRSPAALTCIAVNTPAGALYQQQALARRLLQQIGPRPVSAAPRLVPALASISWRGDQPVGKLVAERTTEYWLGSRPLTPAQLGALNLPSIDGLDLTPVDRHHAYNEPPSYLRTAELQGTGDLVPHFKSALDPDCELGPPGSRLFYTVLDNRRARVVVPALHGKGLTQWLGGVKLAPNQPLALRAGLYPYLVQVDPDHCHLVPKPELPSIDVVRALADGVVEPIGWPTTWQVLGPLPPDAPPLTPDQLREMPAQLAINGLEYSPFPFRSTNHTVNLVALSQTAPGQIPDLTHAPQKLASTTPFAAYLFATLDCPADGYLHISAGADWFMQWFVDGQPLHSATKQGITGKLDTHRFSTPVTKGRHTIAVLVKPGSDGWSLTSLGAFSTKNPDQLPDYRIAPPPAPRSIDRRLNPAFREMAHPTVLAELWRERVSRNRARLAAIIRDLPGSAEAKQAEQILSQP